jgi:uncharacterized protein YdaU (DUF1376 family)
MPLWVADFLAKTSTLEAKEVGSYMLLLMAMWSHGGTLPADQKKLQRVARCGRDWPKIWDAIGHYFDEADGVITNARLTKELQNVAAKREVNAHNGALGGKAKSLKYKDVDLANATVSPKRKASIPEPYTEREKEEGKPSSKKKRGSRLSDDWFLPKEWGDWALEQGLNVEGIRAEADKFKDYWHSKAGPTAAKLDWQGTWRNWIRTATERNPKLTTGHQNGNVHSISKIHGQPTNGRSHRSDPAIEQILRLTGAGATSGDGGFGVGGFGEENGPLWMGTRPQ